MTEKHTNIATFSTYLGKLTMFIKVAPHTVSLIFVGRQKENLHSNLNNIVVMVKYIYVF